MKKFNLLNDIYYQKYYASLYLKKDDELFEFKYQKNDKIFYNLSIKSPIKKVGCETLKTELYDLQSAYGYGGFYTNCDDEDFLDEAFDKYKKRCKNEKIIAEFIRFHPFNDFALFHKKYLSWLVKERKTIAIKLENNYENIAKNYASSLKRNIKKAQKNELIFKKLDISHDNIATFSKLYKKTMQKNDATDEYYFSDEYFKALFNLDETKLFAAMFHEEIINFLAIFKSQNKIYYHLGATNPDFYELNSNAFLFDEIVKFYKDECDFFYLGGGTSESEEDPLYRYKKKFSNEFLHFYIGGNIYDEENYHRLNSLWQKQSKKELRYFLKYRLDV